MRLIDADAFRDYVLGGKPIGLTICEYSESDILSMIRQQPTITQPPNDPLTLEELQEMDGEKIFVRYIDGLYTDEDGAYFGKFEQLVRECNGKLTACELPLEYYGKTWLAYCRKPEGGDKH